MNVIHFKLVEETVLFNLFFFESSKASKSKTNNNNVWLDCINQNCFLLKAKEKMIFIKLSYSSMHYNCLMKIPLYHIQAIILAKINIF